MAKATIVVTANNQVKKGLDPAKKAMLEFQNTVNGLQKKISKAFSFATIATAAVASFNLMKKAATQCVSEYIEAEKVSKRLESVWKNVGTTTGKTYDEVMEYADAIEKTTYFTGEAVEEAALLLAATESLTKEGFERALDASVDLAAALGEDVTSAAQTLSKAIQDPESALTRLKTIGVTFTEDEKEQIKTLTKANQIYEAQALILDKVEQKYKGVAKAINSTPAGTLDNIKDTLGDIRENLGGALLDVISPALETLYGWLLNISDWASQYREQESRDDYVNEMMSIYDTGIQSYDAYKKYKRGLEAFISLVDDKALPLTEVTNPLVAVTNKLRSVMGMGGEEQLIGIDEARETVMNGRFQSTVDAYSKLMEDFEAKIADDLLAINQQDRIASQEQYDSLVAALDMYPEYADSYWKDFLTEWEQTFSPEAQAENLSDAVANVTEYVANHTSDSISKRIADLEENITDAWNMYSIATHVDMDTEAGYILEVIAKLEEQKDELIATRDAVEEIPKANYNFLDNLSNKIAAWLNPNGDEGTVYTFAGKDLFSIDSEQASAAASGIIKIFTDQLGEAGEVAGKLAQNMATMGPVLGAIVTAFEYVVQGFAEVFGDILNEFVEYGLEPLREFGRMIGEVLLPIMEAIMPSVESTAEFLIGIFDTIGTILEPIAHIIAVVIKPALDAIGGLLEFILPFIKALGNAIVSIVGVFDWFFSWVEFLWGSFGNALASIHVGGWYPFRGLGGNDVSMPDSLANHIQGLMMDTNGSYYSSADSASTETAISSAAYRGATQVTINIYQMSPVVGEDGMREFARMVRDEFEALDYYGVSA